MQKETHIQVQIEKVGFKGVGIGTLARDLNEKLYTAGKILEDEIGKKVLIHNTLPGEVVTASVKRNKKNYIEAEKLKTVTKSPLEITPKCQHFNVCGGCKWQNLSYEEQLKIKEEHVREIFAHLGGFDSTLIENVMKPIIGFKTNTPNGQWNYRNKVELSFGWDKNMQQTYGFHVGGRRYDIFDIKECHLMSPRMLEIAQAIGKFVQEHQLAPFKFKENRGLLRSVIIREGTRTGETLVDLLCSGEEFSEVLQDAFVRALQPHGVHSIYLTQIITKRGQKTTRTDTLLDGGTTIREHMFIGNEQYAFNISPSSFFQPNTLQAEVLYEEALKTLQLTSKDTVLDLFCGTGTIGIIAAKLASHVVGIELNPDAIEDAKKNAQLNELTLIDNPEDTGNIQFLVGDVGKVLESLEKEGKLDALQGKKIIVDPPRSGLTPQMIEYILQLKPSHISYVSCNPTTQARDVKLLCNASEGNESVDGTPDTTWYEINKIQPVDMFPHTYHIENIVHLHRTVS